MQRHNMIAAMSGLGLKGMATHPRAPARGDPGGAFDEAVTIGLQRDRTVMEVLADLLKAEAAHFRGPHALCAWGGCEPPRGGNLRG